MLLSIFVIDKNIKRMKFTFHQHIKVQIWQDQEFVIEADSKQEADAIAKKYAKVDVSDTDAEVVDTQFLLECQEVIEPDEKNCTIEIYDGKELIADNRIK